jgi:hypothetical protein
MKWQWSEFSLITSVLPCQSQCSINAPHLSITILKAHNWLESYLSTARWVSRCSFTSDPISGGNQGTIWMLHVHMSMHMCTSLAYGWVIPCNYKYLLHTKVANGTESHKLYICYTLHKSWNNFLKMEVRAKDVQVQAHGYKMVTFFQLKRRFTLLWVLNHQVTLMGEHPML